MLHHASFSAELMKIFLELPGVDVTAENKVIQFFSFS